MAIVSRLTTSADEGGAIWSVRTSTYAHLLHGICRQILKEGQLQRRQLVELQKDLKSSTERMLSSSKSAKEPAAGGDQSDAGGSHFTRDMYSLDTTQSHTRGTGISDDSKKQVQSCNCCAVSHSEVLPSWQGRHYLKA